MLDNITLAKKIMGGFVAVAIIAAFVGYVGYQGAGDLDRHITDVGEVRLPSITALLRTEEALESFRVAQRTMLSPLLDDAAYNRQFANIAQAREDYARYLEAYEQLPSTSEEEAEYARFRTALSNWADANNEFFPLIERLNELGLRNPVQMQRDIESFKADHYLLELRVNQLIDGAATFRGGDDHTACNFGVR